MAIQIEYLGQCGFRITSEHVRIAIDPVLTELMDHGVDIRLYPPVFSPEELDVDYVFCTHEHIDHMSVETLTRVAKANPSTRFMIPAGCIHVLREQGFPLDRIIPICRDQRKGFLMSHMEVTTISTAHPEHQVNEAGLDCNLAYAITMDDVCLVHLGDTYLTEQLEADLKKLDHIDVFFPPINGMDEEKAKIGLIGNLSYEEAAGLAYRVHAKLSIPTHFDMVQGNTENPENFVKALAELDEHMTSWIPVMQQTYTL